jgi:hypothetical protein
VWVRELWEVYLAAIAPMEIDVLVVGNTGEAADAMVSEALLASRTGGTDQRTPPTVVLDAAATIAPPSSVHEFNAIIAPSAYALFALPTTRGQ